MTGFGHNDDDLSSLFCSELAAEVSEPPKGLPSNEYTPRDFADKGRLVLQEGIRLGEEIPLKR